MKTFTEATPPLLLRGLSGDGRVRWSEEAMGNADGMCKGGTMIKCTAKQHDTDVDMVELKQGKSLYAVAHCDFFSSDRDIFEAINLGDEVELEIKMAKEE